MVDYLHLLFINEIFRHNNGEAAVIAGILFLELLVLPCVPYGKGIPQPIVLIHAAPVGQGLLAGALVGFCNLSSKFGVSIGTFLIDLAIGSGCFGCIISCGEEFVQLLDGDIGGCRAGIEIGGIFHGTAFGTDRRLKFAHFLGAGRNEFGGLKTGESEFVADVHFLSCLGFGGSLGLIALALVIIGIATT